MKKIFKNVYFWLALLAIVVIVWIVIALSISSHPTQLGARTAASTSYLTTASATATYLTNSSATATYLTSASATATYSPLAGSASIVTVGTISSGVWSGTVIASNKGGTGTTTLVWPTTPGAASTILTNDGSGNLSWAAAAAGGDLTMATQQAWTSVFTIAFVNTTTVTYTAGSSALGTTTAAAINKKLIQWTDSGGTTVKRGWVNNSTNVGTAVTITVNGDNILSNDTNFRVARYFTPQLWDWYIPGSCVADATNPVGKQYFVGSGTTAQLLSVDGNLGTAGAGNAPTLTFNIYNGANTTIGTAPDFVATANTYDTQFTTNTMAALSRVTIRTPACTFSTTTAADMNINVYWTPNNWFNY